jgi:anhydro-N-acetylmuramic acid kinase
VAAEGAYQELYLCGGGVKNRTLVKMLNKALPSMEMQPVDALGIPSDALEAVIFALLAAETLDGRPIWLPKATGARRPVLLGVSAPGGYGT